MKIITQPTQFRKIPGPVFLAAGFFDGVHKGHQLVLSSTVERAREVGGQAWVLTFDRHPLAVLAPSKCPPLLCTLEERLSLLEATGVDGVLVLEFTRPLAVQEPETFIRWLCGKPRGDEDGGSAKLAASAKLSEIRCGDNWRFGRRASGTPELLAQYGQLYGFRVVIVPYAQYQGVEISSTRIRYAVREGRLDDATAMLGRPYSVRDVVVRGRGVGQSLCVATANLQPSTEVLPPNGVYAVRVVVDGVTFNGVSNLGVHPTFAETKPERAVLETHLLDFDGDLYGKTIEVFFLARLRDELVFGSTEALNRQIAEDVRQAGRHF
ncbi:MAG TPA: riboflavin biosynthesis protein RibF [Kiritimatiellia bacterium]|nr:riboflavin biosynthesis protein RibF [Kiritimatiellia bacterium]HPS09407.1 riboflavin biosynthesis protein RibF [Kiritimatiellia bacterium]